MAAQNNDSKRIFDSYIEKYLSEQLTSTSMPKDEALKSIEDRKNRIQKQQDEINAAAKSTSTATPTNPSQIGAGGYGAAAGTTQQPSSTDQLSFTVKNAQNQAPITQGTTTSPALATGTQTTDTTQVATGEPNQEEKALFKKLHGSEYSPGKTNDAKLAQLRTAGQQAGGYGDVEKVRNAAYAQQYANTDQGTAYAQKAQQLGVNLPKPGEIKAPAPATATAGTAVASNQASQPSGATQQAQTQAPSADITNAIKSIDTLMKSNPQFAAELLKLTKANAAS